MTTVIAAALLLVAIGLFWGSGLLPDATDPNDVGAAGFPQLVAIVMMVFAALLIVQTLRTPEANRAVGRTHPRTLFFMLLTLVHVAAIPFVGRATEQRKRELYPRHGSRTSGPASTQKDGDPFMASPDLSDLPVY